VAAFALISLENIAECTREQCFQDCASPPSERLVGPTPPESDAEYPFAQAPFPLPQPEFCQLGCSLFFNSYPVQLECIAACDLALEENTSVGLSDWVHKARLECRDGCAMAALRCMPGYACRDGAMVACEPGTYRDESYDSVEECVECPKGTYRELPRGRSISSCLPCPHGTYLNQTGSALREDCLRCPYGQHAPKEGMALCECITSQSCEI
jgi:hypothetical protein